MRFVSCSPVPLRAIALSLVSPLPIVHVPADILESSVEHRTAVSAELLKLAAAIEAEPDAPDVEVDFGKGGLPIAIAQDIMLLASGPDPDLERSHIRRIDP